MTLGQRLKDLRERHWPGVALTQAQLARVLSSVKAVTPRAVSSWENGTKLPPPERLDAYATFFCTRRSVEGGAPQLLRELDLTEPEKHERQRLHDELTTLREDAIVHPAPQPPAGPALGPLGRFWRFDDDWPVNIVCAPLPDRTYQKMPFTDPTDPEYVAAYRFQDLDALIELFGHIRAVNPASEVRIRVASDLTADRLTEHLVLLGGVAGHTATREVLHRVDLPLRQCERDDDDPTGPLGFEVVGSEPPVRFGPTLVASPHTAFGRVLVHDVAHLSRTRNPFNQRRTLTICNGTFGHGTYGAVRALTDAKFRNRNEGYLRQRFGTVETFGLLTRVEIVGNVVLTPDWTKPQNRVHEWPGDAPAFSTR
jgi:transcriptional regulator with XRE-family HTH domain